MPHIITVEKGDLIRFNEKVIGQIASLGKGQVEIKLIIGGAGTAWVDSSLLTNTRSGDIISKQDQRHIKAKIIPFNLPAVLE